VVRAIAGLVQASPHQPAVVGRALQGRGGSSPCTQSLARGRGDGARSCAHVAILVDVVWICKLVPEVSLGSRDFSPKPFQCNSLPGWRLYSW